MVVGNMYYFLDYPNFNLNKGGKDMLKKILAKIRECFTIEIVPLKRTIETITFTGSSSSQSSMDNLNVRNFSFSNIYSNCK